MKKTRRRYYREFKMSVVAELECGKPVAENRPRAGIHPSLPSRWRTESITGRIHHSDQGVQCAPGDYVDCLKKHGIHISMSRKGNPYDSAFAESFIKTLKWEEVYLNE